jgi:hypothetical protein
MEIGAGIAAIGRALGIAKNLIDINHQLDKAELKSRLADIYSNLADAKIALADAQASIREKDQSLAELRKSFEEKSAVALHRGFPFTVEEGRVTAGPHCPNCYERKSLVLLGRGRNATLLVCPRCKGEFHHAPMQRGLQERLDREVPPA